MILITGGTGFIGKHLQEELSRRAIDYAVFSKREYDLTVKEQAEAIFARYSKADVILHFACYQAAGNFPAEHTAEQFHINSLIHLNVLDAWRSYAPHAKLIAVGSSCAYPSRADILTEDKFMDGEIHGSVYAYAFTKRLLYAGITAYNDQHHLNGSYIIPPTLFGEYDDFHADTAHVCGALIAKFVRAVREGLPEVEIWGDGSQIREFLYVKEFVKAVLELAPLVDREILNVSPGKGTSIKDLACAIAQAAGFKGHLFFNAGRYVGIREKYLNADKLSGKYKMCLSPALEPGISRTTAWYSQHYDEIANKPKFGRL